MKETNMILVLWEIQTKTPYGCRSISILTHAKHILHIPAPSHPAPFHPVPLGRMTKGMAGSGEICQSKCFILLICLLIVGPILWNTNDCKIKLSQIDVLKFLEGTSPSMK